MVGGGGDTDRWITFEEWVLLCQVFEGDQMDPQCNPGKVLVNGDWLLHYCVSEKGNGENESERVERERERDWLFGAPSLVHTYSRIRCLHPAACAPLCPDYLFKYWLPVPGYTPSGLERFHSGCRPQGEHPIIHLRWRVSSRPRDSLSPASRDGPSCCGPILQIGGWTTGGVYKPTVDPPATYRRCVICHKVWIVDFEYMPLFSCHQLSLVWPGRLCPV